MKFKRSCWIFAISLALNFSTACRADSAFLTVLKAYSDAQQKEDEDNSSGNDLLKTLTDAVEKKETLDEQEQKIREQQQQTINALMQQSNSPARPATAPSYQQSYPTNSTHLGRENSTNSPTVNECLRMEVNQFGQQGVRNVCGFSVQYTYCFQNSHGLFACNVNNRGQGADGVSASGFSILPDYKEEGATGIRSVACKGRTGDVLPMLNENGKTGCYNDVAR